MSERPMLDRLLADDTLYMDAGSQYVEVPFNPLHKPWMKRNWFRRLMCWIIPGARLQYEAMKQWRKEHPIQVKWQPRNLAG